MSLTLNIHFQNASNFSFVFSLNGKRFAGFLLEDKNKHKGKTTTVQGPNVPQNTAPSLVCQILVLS